MALRTGIEPANKSFREICPNQLGGRSGNRMNVLVFGLPLSEPYVLKMFFILGISIYDFLKTASPTLILLSVD